MPVSYSGTLANHPIYCKQCGYDLRACRENRCSECGRKCDPADPKTFAKRPPRMRLRKWLKRGLVLLLTIIALPSAAWGWLYWEWRQEQQALARLGGIYFAADIEPLGPDWLREYLGSADFVLKRARTVYSAPRAPVTDDQLRTLTAVKWLEKLSIYGSLVSDLSPLAKLTALEELECNETKINDLTPLAKLTTLIELNCSDTKVTDLSPLAGLTALQELWFCDTLVSDLSPLSKLTALEELFCSETKIINLAPLASLIALRELDISDTSVSDLRPLANLTALQRLNCRGTKVFDLSPLLKLTGLKKLVVPKETITAAQVQELQKALPNCKIERQ